MKSVQSKTSRLLKNYCKIVFFILACVTFTSCTSDNWVQYRISTNYIKSVSDIKYKDISNVQKPFRTDGYYILKEKDPYLVKGIEYILIFYNDGTFSYHPAKGIRESNDPIEIDKYIMRARAIIDNMGEFYGVYRIDLDTIFVNKYRKTLFGFFGMYKLKFRIINNETLLLCYLEDPQQVYKGETIQWDRNDMYVFKPAKLPKPRDKFLKKKQWYWKNEADWRQYMAR